MRSTVLKEDPPLTGELPTTLVRVVSRCLEKTLERRFQSARDLAFGLEVVSETGTSAVAASVVTTPRRWNVALGAAVVVLSLLIAAGSWLTRRPSSSVENPLANARFTRFTDWEGTEALAEISPDGRFVTFLADRDGQFDVWLSQVGTDMFRNLTADIPPMSPPGGVLRYFGFSGDGSEIWFSLLGRPGDRKMLMPLLGGKPRVFLGEGDVTPSWSPDGTRLVYFDNKEGGGDPLFVADHSGADARQILAPEEGVLHNHNPVWSTDGEWDLVRPRTIRSDERDGGVAHSSVWGDAGAVDRTAGKRQLPGTARPADAAVRRAGGRSIGAVAVGAGRGHQGRPPGDLWARTIHVRGRQS